MIQIPFALQPPLLTILAGVLLCLIFETAGVKEGFRRHGTKRYISLVSALVIGLVFFLIFYSEAEDSMRAGGLVFDTMAKSSILALSVLCASSFWVLFERLKTENADRGELYAMLLFVFFLNIILCSTDSLTIIATAFLAILMAQIVILAMRKKRRTTPELALRWVISGAFLLVFFTLIFIFERSAPVKGIVMITVLIFMIGAAPVQSFQVDSLDGAPSYTAVFLCGSSLISTLTILWRLSVDPTLASLTPRLAATFMTLGGVCLCVLPIMALDQRRMSRLVAYLITSQAGIVLIFASVFFMQRSLPVYALALAFTHFALCAAGAGAGLNFWKNTRHPFKTWEDFAGAGRQNPLEAGAFFIVLASVCGLPFTSGFVLRNTLIAASSPEYRPVVILIFWASTILSAVPVFRLFAFFYGKNTRHELKKHHKPRRITLLFVCACLLFLASLAPVSTLNVVFDLGQK